MSTTLLLANLTAVLLYMSLWYLVAHKAKKLSVVDVAWGSGFALIAWLTVWQDSSARSILIAILVSVWALRITNHLARRVFGGTKDDPRYEQIASKWRGSYWLRAYFSIFLLQGVLVWLISFPVMFATSDQHADLAILSVVGAALWAIGFGIEAAADRQLRDFVNYKPNKGKVMDQGLWRYSRHPNYFGELLQWWAIGVIALQTSLGWIGLVGPLTLTILIVFVSGIPPIENRKKSSPAYAEYMRRTSKLVPLPPRSV